MLKKILILLILGIVAFSTISMDAFCDEQHESTEHHHGIVVCNSSCHALADMNSSSEFIPNNTSSSTQISAMASLIYQNPTLDRILRPPIYSL